MTTAPPAPDLSTLELTTPDGHPTTLGSLTAPLLVVQLVRYFGCLPCQDWLVELDGASDRLAASGAAPLAIGGSADYQARWLRDDKQVRMPLLLDSEQVFRAAVGLGRLGARLLDPRGLPSYVGAMRRGYRPQKITKDTVQAPGVVILDADRRVVWQHVGRRIGDYPALGTVLTAVHDLAGA